MWSFKMMERHSNAFVLPYFWKGHAMTFICIICKYVCILVCEKLVCLLSYVLIIVYCDSQKLELIHDEWGRELQLGSLDGLAWF